MDIKNNKKSNRIIHGKKGFTLVELIVVLVIVTVLAAIAVPAFFGFIDKSHEKNVIANARVALSATQAALSDIYSSNDNRYDPDKRDLTRQKAGADTTTAFTVWNVRILRDTKTDENPETRAITDEIGSYTVGKAIYKEDEGTFAAYDGNDWVIYGSYSEAKTAIGVSDDDKKIIHVWPYSEDLAYVPDTPKEDVDYPDYTEEKDPGVTKTVVLKVDRREKSFFATKNTVGDETVYDKKAYKLIELTFVQYDNGEIECEDWVPEGEDLNRFNYNGETIVLGLPERGFMFANWREDEGERTFTEKMSMGQYIFSNEGEIFTFVAQLEIVDRDISATLDRDKFIAFLDANNTSLFINGNVDKPNTSSKQTNAVVKVATDSIELETLQDNPAIYTRVDDGNSNCDIYMWYEGSTLYWWSNALEKSEEVEEDHAYMPVDCSELLKKRNFTTFDFSGFNMAKVTTTANMFDTCVNLQTVNFGQCFAAPDLRDMSGMFQYAKNYQPDLSGIISVADTVDISRLFYNMNNVKDGERTGQEYVNAKADDNTITSVNLGTFLSNKTINTKITDCEQTFSGLDKITSLDLSGWNVSEIHSCYGVCAWCQSLTSIDFGVNGWNMPLCTDMSFMFYECDGIVDGTFFSKLKTGTELTTLSNAFCKMDNVTIIDLSGIDPTNVTNLESMVRLDKKLVTLNLNAWRNKPKKINRLRQTFQQCNSLRELDMCGWNVSDINDSLCLSNLTFEAVKALQVLDLTGWKVTGVDFPTAAFQSGNFTKIVLKDAEFSRNTSLENVFNNKKNLTELDLTNFKAPNVTNISGMFKNCSSLTKIDMSSCTLGTITNMKDLFSGCTALTTLNLSNLNVSQVQNFSGMFKGCKGLTTLAVENWNTASATDMSYMFSGCTGLTTLNVGGFNTSGITNMSYMFEGCTGISSLDLSTLNTSNVQNFSGMFKNCTGFTTLDVTGFDTSAATNMNSMFSGCSNLSAVDVSRFVTASVTDMGYMFNGCKVLTTLDVSGFVTSSVTNMSNMFNGCSGLTTLDVSGFLTPNVTDMNYMFYNCSGVAVIDVSGFDTTKVTNMSGMFRGCSSVGVLDVSHFSTSLVTSMERMFNGCSLLTVLDVSSFDTSSVKNVKHMFDGLSHLTSLNIANFDVEKIDNLEGLLSGCTEMVTLNMSGLNLNKVTNAAYLFNGMKKLENLNLSNVKLSSATSLQSMFSGCEKLSTLDLSGFEAPNATNVKEMFRNCKELTSVDLSGCNLQAVTNMNSMFNSCYKLKSVNLKNVNMDSVTNMGWMFADCKVLETIEFVNMNSTSLTDINGLFRGCNNLKTVNAKVLDVSKVTNMNSVFLNCNSLETIDLEGWDTSSATQMESTFQGCSSLTSLDVTGFNVEKVENMVNMFNGCSKLTSLNLSGFNVSKVSKMNNMFYNCSELKTLDISGWNVKTGASVSSLFFNCKKLTTIYATNAFPESAANTDIFQNCNALVGGKETKYADLGANKNKALYARIDGGPGSLTEGYFTQR